MIVSFKKFIYFFCYSFQVLVALNYSNHDCIPKDNNGSNRPYLDTSKNNSSNIEPKSLPRSSSFEKLYGNNTSLSEETLQDSLSLNLSSTKRISFEQFEQIMLHKLPNGNVIAEYFLRQFLPRLDEKGKLKIIPYEINTKKFNSTAKTEGEKSKYNTISEKFLTLRIKHTLQRKTYNILTMLFPPDRLIPREICLTEYHEYLYQEDITQGLDAIYVIKFSPDTRKGKFKCGESNYYNYLMEKKSEKWGLGYTDTIQIIDVSLPEDDMKYTIKEYRDQKFASISDSFRDMLLLYEGKFIKQFWWSCLFKHPQMLQNCLQQLYMLIHQNPNKKSNIFYSQIQYLLPLDVLTAIANIINNKENDTLSNINNITKTVEIDDTSPKEEIAYSKNKLANCIII